MNESKEVSDELLDAQDPLLGALSHDLRSPLMVLSGNVTFLVRSQDKAQRQEVAEECKDALDRLGLMIDNIDLTVRLRTERALGKAGRCELVGIVRENIGAVRSGINLRELSMQLGLRDEPAWVRGDPLLLHAMVRNAIRDSLEFAPIGSRLRIGTNVGDGRVTITVHDEGPSVPAHFTEAYFRPEQAHELRNQGIRVSRALSLSLCREIAVIHGGGAELRNNPGRELQLWLPLE